MPKRFHSGRRRFLGLASGCALLPLPALADATAQQRSAATLRAAPVRLSVLGPPHPDTEVWAYNASVPGPLLRIGQGERLDVSAINDLPYETTVHWHGIRLPNRMDGVPHLTQPPIAPGGGRFDYGFTCPDAGTFWYHPHARGNVQVEMGLHGALIVDEPTPVPVDRDVLWVLDDWRMRSDGQVAGDFDDRFDATHAGRIGNTVTINGALPDSFELASGERIRLRLLNVANARIFALVFEGHAPYVVAHDGMPCEPYVPERGRIVLGPGMRADLILDATHDPGTSLRVIDEFVPRQAFELVKLVYREGKPVRSKPLASRIALPANPVALPDLAKAARHRFAFSGGMMGRMPGGMAGMRNGGHVWAINGKSMDESQHVHAPLLTLRHGAHYVLEFVNDTAWWHPMHLHGHTFRIVSRNGVALERTLLADTMLLPPRERAEIALVADNPGDWMFHCHVLEHQATGMMATIRVA